MGATTPAQATTNARPPTAIISCGVDSRPTLKSSRTAPSSASSSSASLSSSPRRSGPPSEREVPEHQAGRQLAQHGGLAQARRQGGAQLGADQDHGAARPAGAAIAVVAAPAASSQGGTWPGILLRPATLDRRSAAALRWHGAMVVDSPQRARSPPRPLPAHAPPRARLRRARCSRCGPTSARA